MGWRDRGRQIARAIGASRRALLLRTLPSVLAIVVTKLLVEWLDWEFIVVSPLHTSIVAGAIFIVGLMLTGTMSDYKESERLPTDLAAAIESIYREGVFVKALNPTFDLDRLVRKLGRIPSLLRDGLLNGGDPTITAVEDLTDSFIEMDRLGVPPNYIARLKQEQATIVRNLLRADYVQRIAFLPSAYTLVEIMLSLLIALLTFTRVANGATDAIVLGFISLIFLYILRLLRLLDTPFRPSGAGLDDVSLFQMGALRERLLQRVGEEPR